MNEAIEWFLVRLAAEIPRMHSRDTGADGDPELHPSLVAYIDDGWNAAWGTIHRDDTDLCAHPTITDSKAHCPTCDDTGLRVRSRKVYRRPMKRALSELGARRVPTNRPRLDDVLWVLAEHDGNVGLTLAALAQRSAFMARPGPARRWLGHALWALRRAYKEDAPARIIDKSQAQIDAEAA